MDWVTLLATLITVLFGQGIIALFTIRETKKGMKLDNKEKEDNRYITLINELQDQNEKLNEKIDKKDARITELEDRCTILSSQLDTANTELAKATLLRCSRIECSTRIPPFGYRNVDLDKDI